MQCAFSPLGNTAIAGLVHIARKTNRFARENIFSNVSGKCSFGICSRTSVDITPSKGPSGKFSYEAQEGHRVQAYLFLTLRDVSILYIVNLFHNQNLIMF